MGLKDDLTALTKETFKSEWREEITKSVPDPQDLQLNNHAKNLEKATVLYADIDGSTSMVDNYKWYFSAEIYKSYLQCAAKIIKSEGGVITAYDGDRVMAIFTGDSKNTSAVRCALEINYAVIKIINPALKEQYPSTKFKLKHVIGIDTSQLRTARIGVRGDNDLVWIGRAANHAAKLTSLPDKPLWITKSVYDSMNKTVKYAKEKNMWTASEWSAMNDMPIYGSSYYWWNIA
ncbi:MAG: adenylate/guanylate cyclase domain-containing protein [Methylovulum sp.]|nr:adenylate/guanylate cyclase domain-containing protein [Methylovulum sp.]